MEGGDPDFTNLLLNKEFSLQFNASTAGHLHREGRAGSSVSDPVPRPPVPCLHLRTKTWLVLEMPDIYPVQREP